MRIEFKYAQHQDLPQITDIYNQAIPGRQATADLEPVTVASKEAWFAAFTPDKYPIWLIMVDGNIAGWVSLEAFYGRPAYSHTAEISIYLDQHYQHQQLGQAALDFVFSQLPHLALDTIVAFVFHHNGPSQHLFTRNGFDRWGHLPRVALMDGQRRDLDILGRHFGKNM
ncbi:GNAT family N-acetyltransferase [Lacticaseibacillus thailandensis]|uniref:Phosphinothricin N-acetyltransferase n=1 Tax=Lacticaseibacillus thailandensis DSM 22698 = JCM 13996 TaxID=1423810 RepID=A0A0R2CGJ5_9LACO|nr:GNAT family N-acetyltransferase [Lacticaseibacillus thailandensis]KRM87110.1 phosphinothricin N-acetyltransferase [Lacticaseibacillus thailandensis DSM 22698 = JCM 13996]